ncbi:MAG TPA: GTP cyclohydrolase I FolE [Chitinophagaceae bacterium]
MKQNGTMLKIEQTFYPKEEGKDQIDGQHLDMIPQTPLRVNAFELTDEEKIDAISVYFKKIMCTLGLDLEDDSLKGTPGRVAKMFVKEIFSGLNHKNKPIISLFDNKYKYNQMLIEKNIALYSNCEHHFVPIIGKAHIAYISTGKVIGISKINRIVRYYAQRPQVQERLTMQIANELKSILHTEDVAVVIDALHLCVSSRGVRDTDSNTITAEYGGVFLTENRRDEFLKHLNLK